MSFLFGGSKVPSVQTVPAPKLDDNEIKKQEASKIKKGRTSRPTLMTGPQGLLEPAPVSKKTLLGE